MRAAFPFRLRRIILPIALAVCVFVLFQSYQGGPPAGTTNAPGETSCATSPACHIDTPNTGPGFAEITVMGGVPANGYKPGETLTLMPYMMNTGDSVMGFETVVLFPDGKNAGSVMITDPVKTQMVTSSGLEYVMQTQTGSLKPGMHDWMYDWVAPPKGSGGVVVYGAFVSANNDNTSGGDRVYTDTLYLPEDVTAGTGDPASQSLRFHAVRGQELLLSIYNPLNHMFTVRVYDMSGRSVWGYRPGKGSMDNNLAIDWSQWNRGIYLVELFDLDDYTRFVSRVAKL